MKLLKRFWAYFLSLAALVGFYVTVLPTEYAWLFWVVAGVALILAALTTAVPRVLAWLAAIRNYPRLLQTAAQSQTQNEHLRLQLRETGQLLEDRWSEGVDEGRKQVFGGLLAEDAPMLPAIIAISPAEDSPPVLIAKWPRQIDIVGARYRLEARATGNLRGIVEVTAQDETEDLCSLTCVDATNSAFWQHLADRALVDESPPTDTTLHPAVVDVSGAVVSPPPATAGRLVEIDKGRDADA